MDGGGIQRTPHHIRLIDMVLAELQMSRAVESSLLWTRWMPSRSFAYQAHRVLDRPRRLIEYGGFGVHDLSCVRYNYMSTFIGQDNLLDKKSDLPKSLNDVDHATHILPAVAKRVAADPILFRLGDSP